MKFKLTYKPTGNQLKYRATDWTSFESDLHRIELDNDELKLEYEYFINDKSVDFDAAVAAVKVARQEYWDKLNLTKKEVWVLHGVCNLPQNWCSYWVKK